MIGQIDYASVGVQSPATSGLFPTLLEGHDIDDGLWGAEAWWERVALRQFERSTPEGTECAPAPAFKLLSRPRRLHIHSALASSRMYGTSARSGICAALRAGERTNAAPSSDGSGETSAQRLARRREASRTERLAWPPRCVTA